MADLRFGTFLAPAIMPVYETVAEAVGRRLGLSTELVVETDYESCVEDINDVCFVCSLPYVHFEREGLSPAVPVAAPVLSESRYEGRPIYFSDVIVATDSDAHGFLDLRGRSWSYNEPLSHSGYGLTRYCMLQLGETSGFFGDVVETGFHETSIEMVRSGDIDASAIDSQVLSVTLHNDPTLADTIRVIDTFGPSTIQPVAVSKRIDPELTTEIVDALLRLHEDRWARKRLDECMVDHFVPVDAASYDDIRMMLEACEAAGFMDVR